MDDSGIDSDTTKRHVTTTEDNDKVIMINLIIFSTHYIEYL